MSTRTSQQDCCKSCWHFVMSHAGNSIPIKTVPGRRFSSVKSFDAAIETPVSSGSVNVRWLLWLICQQVKSY